MPRASAATSSRCRAYARQFLEMMQKPDVDHIEGLSPAISIEQKTTSRNPRSTVATVTEIYDYMRLLWARVGVPYSPGHRPADRRPDRSARWSTGSMPLPEGTRLYLLAPVVRGRKGEYRKELAEWQKAGFTRVRIDGAVLRDRGRPRARQEIQARHRGGGRPAGGARGHRDAAGGQPRDGAEARRGPRLSRSGRRAAIGSPADAVRSGRRGEAVPERGRPAAGDGRRRARRSSATTPPKAGSSSPRNSPARSPASPSPRSSRGCSRSTRRRAPARPATGSARSSFRSRPGRPQRGAQSIKKGAVVPWARSNPPSPYYMQVLGSLAREFGFSLETPWNELPEEVHDIILHGTKGRPVTLRFIDGRKSYEVKKPFDGVIGNLNRRMLQTESAWMREELSKYQSAAPCETCHGARLRPEPLAVKIAGEHISQVDRRSASATRSPGSRRSTEKLNPTQQRDRPRDPQGDQRAARLPQQCRPRLSRPQPHLGHACRAARASASASPARSARACRACSTCSTSRRSASTSATTIGCSSPSSGCAISATPCSSSSMTRMRSAHADYVIDMGPGAGMHGGEIVCQGTLEDVLASENSLTADYLTGRRAVPIPAKRRKGTGKKLTLHGATANNLKNVTAAIPLGTFSCITGVSGSGKSSFTIDTLYAAAARQLNGARIIAGRHEKLTGLEYLDKVIDIDQSPIGRTPRSNPATYTGAFTQIRDWFAGLPESAGARLQARPVQLQRQGRPLRGLQGRRPDQDRDALPARRLRHLRRLPRPALQSRDAGGEVQGPQHRRRARHDGRGRRRVLQGGPPDPRQDARCWRRSASATSRSASRRRR